MKTGKKVLAAGLAALLSVSALTACGSSGAESSAAGASPASVSSGPAAAQASDGLQKFDTPQQIHLLVDNDVAPDGLNAVIKSAKEKLNIDVEVEIRPGGTEGDNVVKTRFASGDMTDLIVYNSGALMQAINPEKYLLDLSNESFAASLDDTYKKSVTVNGKIYGVPFASTQAGVWLYNKAEYKKLGLSVPNTWKELIANCDKIKAAGKTAIIGSYKTTWTAQLPILADEYNVLAKSPSFPTDYTENKAKYATTPAALSSWQKLAQTNKYLNQDYLATTTEDALKMLVDGKGVQYPMLSQALGNIYTLYPDQISNIGTFGQPGDDAGNHGITVWEPTSIYISAQSSNQEAAKRFLAYYISKDGIADYASKVKPDGPYAIKGMKLPADAYPAVQEMQKYFDDNKTALALEFESPVKGTSLEQICIECGSGLTTPEKAAAAYDKDVEKQAVQLGLKGW